MESADAGLWLSKVNSDEKLCWGFLAKQDWLSCEASWVADHSDPSSLACQAWALGPLAKLTELEEFREARMLARRLIWEDSHGSDSKDNPYAGPVGKMIERMFDESFAHKVGAAKVLQIELQAEKNLMPLAKSMGRGHLDAADLSRLAKLRCVESFVPKLSRGSYIGPLAVKHLSEKAEQLTLKFFYAKKIT